MENVFGVRIKCQTGSQNEKPFYMNSINEALMGFQAEFKLILF